MSAALWQVAYVALGSNLEQPAQQVQSAIGQLRELRDSRLVAASALYRSAPLYRADASEVEQPQPMYINAVVALLTTLDASQFLTELQGIEQRMGRVRAEAWGPRIIDLDLLTFITADGENRMSSETLTLPHPGLTTRNFVMVPLADIAPALRVGGRTAMQWATALGMQGLERLA